MGRAGLIRLASASSMFACWHAQHIQDPEPSLPVQSAAACLCYYSGWQHALSSTSSGNVQHLHRLPIQISGPKDRGVSMPQVSKVCQPLDDLRDLAASDSVDTFVLSYTSLLQACAQHP